MTSETWGLIKRCKNVIKISFPLACVGLLQYYLAV